MNTGETWDVFSAAAKHGYWVAKGAESLAIKKPEKHVAAALGVEVGVPLLMLDRIIFAFDGKPFEWLVSWCSLTRLYYDLPLI